MTKKKAVFLTVFLVFAAAGYVYLYGDAFQKKTIRIYHTGSRAAMMRRPNAKPAPPTLGIVFALYEEHRLTSVKVVPRADYDRNKYSHPVWELISDSNSVPVKAFAYGENIRGMHPAVKGAVPEPLTNDVPYILLVAAGKLTGTHDFTIPGTNTPPAATNSAAQ